MKTYDVAKQKGSNRWYAHLTGSEKVMESPLSDKKTALHAAADLMGMGYKEYMSWRRRQGCM